MLSDNEILDGKYKIIRVLGKGGSGQVYLAQNLKIGNYWAVKEVNTRKQLRTNLLAEVEILKKVNHRCIPRIVDLIERKDYIYIVEDYFDGSSLKDLIKCRELCSAENIIRWGRQLCEILAYLHNLKPNPIIYRDMKPGNIIIDNENNVKLVDLGIARVNHEENDSETLCIGTKGYAAPEQYSGMGHPDNRSDIYGLGATLYHVLTGYNPNQPPYCILPVTQINSALSVEIERIIKKCTSSNPDLRYQRVEEVIADLDNTQKSDELIRTTAPNVQYMEVTNKLVVIGSLSARAGSSFITANLAAALAKRNRSVGVVEFPANIPYMYDALFLRQKTDGRYVSLAHEIRGQRPINRDYFFNENGVNWVLLDPSRQTIKDWSPAEMLSLIYSVKNLSVILLDISTNWCHQGVSQILRQADHIFLVVDPDPALIDRTAKIDFKELDVAPECIPEELKIMELVCQLEDSGGCCAEFILNKYTNPVLREQLGLPCDPIAYVPFIDPHLAYSALWKGDLVYNYPDVRETLDRELYPVVRRIAPALSTIQENSSRMIFRHLKNVYQRLTEKKEVFK
ncbi:MAG: protein kinase [Thermincola sp.]|nr:protein kinase [Thermincola sp.]